ncbi:MAG TPA: AAA family ATPase [Streptosporangiaceae bacterium]|nr:AAA family ATPase [Streptosporangiaceae bacterium]
MADDGGHGIEDFGPAGYGIADYGPAGAGIEDPGPAGYGIADYGPAGPGIEDLGPTGYGIEDYGPAAYETGGLAPDGRDPAGYVLADCSPAARGPDVSAAEDQGSSGLSRPPGHEPQDYGQPHDYGSPGPYGSAEDHGPAPPSHAGAGITGLAGSAGKPAAHKGAGREAAAWSGPAGRGATPRELQPPPASDATERLTPALLLPRRRRAPSPGWRRLAYQATGGVLRVPLSAAELRRQDMIGRARAPVVGGHHRVAVMSLKGGVGKTTTAVALGSTLAGLRGDRVIAVDASPDRGTLSDKVQLETAATIRDLLNERAQIRRYADVRTFTSQATSGLEILTSDRDPTVSVALSDDDYCNVCGVLEHYYSICLTDCGTGLMHAAMAGILRLADQVVMVSTPSVDGARSASATLDWLEAHGHGGLVREAVVVLCAVRARSRSSVDLNRLQEYFAARCRAVTRIPYDAHLEEGAEIDLDLLSRGTADSYLALAAIVGDGLARPGGCALPRHGTR